MKFSDFVFSAAYGNVFLSFEFIPCYLFN